MTRFQVFFVIVSSLTMVLSACGGTQSGGAAGPATEADIGDDTLETYKWHMEQAGLAQAEQRLDDALANYLAAAEVLEENGEPTVKEADAHYEAANLAYQKYEKELAVQEYEKAIALYLRFGGNSQSKAVVAYTNLGVVYKEMHEKAKARTCWQQALSIVNGMPEGTRDISHVEKIKQNIRDLDEGY